MYFSWVSSVGKHASREEFEDYFVPAGRVEQYAQLYHIPKSAITACTKHS